MCIYTLFCLPDPSGGRPRVLSIDRKGASGATAHGGVTTNGDHGDNGGARDDEAMAS